MNIPADVLHEIVDCAVITPGGYDIPSVKAWTLTNKFLRRVTVPILFQSLKFKIKTSYGLASYGPDDFNTVLTHLIQIYKRIYSLRRAPHLLEHVRELSLDQWSKTFYGSISGTGINQMVLVIYESLICLVERMPRLRHIKVSSSPISARLLPLLFSSPHIERISLSLGTRDSTVDIPPDLPISHHIRHFYSRRYRNEPSLKDMYLPIIFEHCGRELQSLDVMSTELPRITTLASHHALTLRTLVVSCDINGDDRIISDIWTFLPHCPELRVLRISPFLMNGPPPYLAPNIIPHLESLSVRPGLPPIFTIGRNIKSINIIGMADGYPVHDVVGHPTALRQLSLAINIARYGDIPQFIDSLNICTNLVILRMSFTMRFQMKSEMTPEELEPKGIMDALRQLKTLRVCDVTGFPHDSRLTEIICPMGSMGNPDDRGHLSLEAIRAEYIDTRWWVWFHSEGWKRMSESYHLPYAYEV